MVSPGLSSTPANMLPIITAEAPAAIALTRSPVYRIPPSAMIGIFIFFNTEDASKMAVT